MTTLQLHPLPSMRAVVREQFRAVTLVTRKFLVLLGGLLVVADAVVIYSVLAANELARRGLPNQGVAITPGFAPFESFIVGIVAIMLAVLIWLDEDTSRRDYHWTMPVSRTTHALSKVFVGWVLMMVTTLAALVNLLMIGALSVRMQYPLDIATDTFPVWSYLVPFTTATVAYLFASAASVGARRPMVWIMGIPTVYAGIAAAFSFGSFAMKKDVLKPLTSEYGLASLAGDLVTRSYAGYQLQTHFMVGRWVGSVAIWGTIAAALLVYVASRRRRNVGTWAFALLNRWASRYVPAA
ncbi:MAG: hypothetical protein V4550_16420 [Gemmatimonadota bacterium]